MQDGQTCKKPDQVELLRQQTVEVYIPIFEELAEKYKEPDISMEMDVSNFLNGGREISIGLAVGAHRSTLLGTVTAEGIAFHETRYAPEVRGELVSGPMLRLKSLNADRFRQFVCGRLALLLRAALRSQK